VHGRIEETPVDRARPRSTANARPVPENRSDTPQTTVSGYDDIKGPTGHNVAQPVLTEHIAVHVLKPRNIGHLVPARMQNSDRKPAPVQAERDPGPVGPVPPITSADFVMSAASIPAPDAGRQ